MLLKKKQKKFLKKTLKRKSSCDKLVAFEPPILKVGDIVSYIDKYGHYGPAGLKLRFSVIQVYQNKGQKYLFRILKKYCRGNNHFATVLPLNKLSLVVSKYFYE